jgi:hypothetical protein
MRRVISRVLVGMVFALALATPALAASNPNGTGQPSAECGEPNASSEPKGFTDSQGFANAEAHYAGSDGTPSQAHAGSTHAVSQYDVACYQNTANH